MVLILSFIVFIEAIIITYIVMLLNKFNKKLNREKQHIEVQLRIIQNNISYLFHKRDCDKDTDVTYEDENDLYETITVESPVKKRFNRDYDYDDNSECAENYLSKPFECNPYNNDENYNNENYNNEIYNNKNLIHKLNNIFQTYERVPDIIKSPFYYLPYVLMLFRSAGIACCIQNITLNKFQMLQNMNESLMKKSFIQIGNEQYIYYVPEEVYIDMDKTSINTFSKMFDITNSSGLRKHLYYIEQSDNNEKKRNDITKLFDYFGIEKESYLI